MPESFNDRRSFLIGSAASLLYLPLAAQTPVSPASPAAQDGGFHVDAGASRPEFVTHASPKFSEQCKIRSADTDNRFCLLEQTADRGIAVGLHRHMTADEWFFITTGSFVFEQSGKRSRLGPGETLLIPRATPHRWISLEDKSSYIFGFTPSRNLEGFFSELHEAQNSGKMSMVKLKEIGLRYDSIFDGAPMTLAEAETPS
jgi:mannose-6-phosphate isomerase-like protein (cupin superfamily)